jgi:hypothetical protein
MIWLIIPTSCLSQILKAFVESKSDFQGLYFSGGKEIDLGIVRSSPQLKSPNTAKDSY